MKQNKALKKHHFKKQIVIPVAVLIAAGMITLGSVSANAYFGGEHRDDLVNRLSERLNVDKSKVEGVLDELQNERQKAMEAKFLERLNQAVKDGKITESQKAKILSKHQELAKRRDEERSTFQSLTPEQRKEKRQSERAELEAWAKAQGLDLSLFFGGMGQKGMIGRGISR